MWELVKLERYEVLVVGGGPAGIMAAARAAAAGTQVLLLDKNASLGRKMLITGGGRCNVTNQCDINEMISNIPGNGRFLYSALQQFSGQDVRSFLKQLGVPTKIEDKGRVFPSSDKAADVVDALAKHLQRLGVAIRYQTKVDELLIQEKRCIGVRVGQQRLWAKAVVVATGGLSYSKTGSTGEGYKMARQVGHQVTSLFPAAVSVTCSDLWIVNRNVQGLSLADVRLTVYNQQGKILATEMGDVIFTHWGLSGPGTLRVGRSVALQKQKDQKTELKAELDLFPLRKYEELENELLGVVASGGKRAVKNVLTTLLPERLVRVLADLAQIPLEVAAGQLNKNTWRSLICLFKAVPLHIKGTRPLEEATVTGGGVHIKEINPRTMESKLIKNLYFAGEVLDVDAHTGGFNMQVAFSTGFAAGDAAANQVKERS